MFYSGMSILVPNSCNDIWVQELAITPQSWQILYFQDRNTSASTPHGTRESIYSIANGAADDTTVKNVTFTKARGESEMSRIEQFISLVELVNQKPWILIKS